MTVNKVERLLLLLNALMSTPRPLTAHELRARVAGYPEEDQSFRRAFERDKDEIREMGIPLLMETVPGTDPPAIGYRVRPGDAVLVDPGLDPEELEALNLAAAVVGPGGGLGQRALYKLGGGATDEAAQAEVPASPDLIAAFTGVSERRSVRFTYHDTERVVHPYRLEFQRGRWYLNGYDETRGEDRWFRFSRLQGPLELHGPPGGFERPETAVAGLRVEPWQLGGDSEPVTASVWFDAEVAPAVRGELGDVEIERDDADGMVVRLRVTNRSGFRSWLLTYLERAEVLEPEDLRAEVVQWLEAVASGGGG